LLLNCRAVSAQNEEHRVRNIVLVHSAWADGSGWKGVYDILVKDGYNVSVIQVPETSFKDDVAATKRVLAQQDGPAILVGHRAGCWWQEAIEPSTPNSNGGMPDELTVKRSKSRARATRSTCRLPRKSQT
jgi:hypothetical protein